MTREDEFTNHRENYSGCENSFIISPVALEELSHVRPNNLSLDFQMTNKSCYKLQT